MKNYAEIPEDEERKCFECEEYTEQTPHGIQIFNNHNRTRVVRGGFAWKWECTECETVQV